MKTWQLCCCRWVRSVPPMSPPSPGTTTRSWPVSILSRFGKKNTRLTWLFGQCNNIFSFHFGRSSVPQGETCGRRATWKGLLQPHSNAEYGRGRWRRRPGCPAVLLCGGHVHGHNQLHPQWIIGDTFTLYSRAKTHIQSAWTDLRSMSSSLIALRKWLIAEYTHHVVPSQFLNEPVSEWTNQEKVGDRVQLHLLCVLCQRAYSIVVVNFSLSAERLIF